MRACHIQYQPKKETWMRPSIFSWQVWAFLSALFAALTTIFVKIGVENIANSSSKTNPSRVAYA
jgi:hypothetical protein